MSRIVLRVNHLKEQSFKLDMKAIVWGILFLTLSMPALAFVDGDIYDREFLIIENSISSDIEIIRKAPDNELDYIKTTLFFKPVSDPRLEVFNMVTTPDAKRENESFVFTWESNETDSVSYSVKSIVKTKTVYDILPNKVKFPLQDIPPELEKYLDQTESVDYYDLTIRRQANQLVDGEDDLYIVVNKIGVWIQDNIEYNLSTVTADASQKASWVMDNRYGVCDEITNLFLAMTRSLGIPSRFVSGLAYTNSPLFTDKWGPHGWAEVYFPGYGWVPFDITYRQYGWLDPSHIKLRDSLDAKDPSTKFEWRGRNVDLKVNPLTMTAEIKEKGPKLNYELEILVTPLKESIGFDSYNLVKAEIINYNNYYKTTDVSIADTEGLTILDDQTRTVILKPYEKEEFYWKVKVDNGLDSEFLYTFPILVYNQRNITGNTEFKVKKGEPTFSEFSIDQLKETVDVPVKKVYSEEIALQCTSLLPEMFPKEQNYLNCTVSNKGNKELEEVKVCYQAECQLHNLLIGESKTTAFLLQNLNIGKNEELVLAKFKDMQTTDVVKIIVLDAPNIKIVNITHPDWVVYEDEFDIAFTLKKESVVNPVNIDVKVTDGVIQNFHLDDLDGRQKFVISTKGSFLKPGKNEIKIEVLYHDSKFKRYKISDKITIKLKEPTFTQKIMIYLNRFGIWFQNFLGLHKELLEN